MCMQTAINEAQFVLFMSPKSSVAEASELFHDLDSEETGFLDATALMLVSYAGEAWRDQWVWHKGGWWMWRVMHVLLDD